jgi:hypothetical protein
MASDIGHISATGGSYLKFLIAVHQLVEADESIEVRVAALIGELERPAWAEIVAIHTRTNLVDFFFPAVLDTISGLSYVAKASLRAAGLSTAPALSNCSRSDLMALKGIGPVMSQALLEHAQFLVNIGVIERCDAVAR